MQSSMPTGQRMFGKLRMSAVGRRMLRSTLSGVVTVSLSWGLFPAVAQAQDDEGWHPEQIYGPMMDAEDESATASATAPRTSAAADIAAWAQLKEADGPDGRPLPMTGAWMAEKMFGPQRFIEMIEAGHHVLPTFSGVHFGIIRQHLQDKARLQQMVEGWRPSLEYARRHRLPIVFREWNWGAMPPGYQQLLAQLDKQEIPPDDDLRVIQDGKPGKETDPFGPLDGWRDWGEIWLGNDMLRQIQQVYPDPPMVIFLNNNEGPKVRSADQLPDDYPRMLTFLDGKAPADKREKERAIRAGYQQRYAAMFEAARAALVEPAWKENTKFVAYNNLWDTGYIGQGNRPHPGIWFEPDEGWLAWRMYHGGMPELYDNDWQPGKRDYSATHSPQTEAMNYHAAQPWIFAHDPDFYWSAIVWDGGRMNDIFRGRRATSKTFHYASRGQRWDFARYEGWVQFSLWTTRPRTMREFRYPPSDRHAYDEGTFMALVRSVDRPWNHAILREFWRFGQLVPNPDEGHPWALGENKPDWVREFERWYLLTCDANPPREEWQASTALRVFAQALVLGEAPQRRWLIIAHAPLGAAAKPTVTLPGYAKDEGAITLPSVPKSGAVFLLDEQTGELQTLIVGGPHELSLQADRRHAQPDGVVQFEAHVTHAPQTTFSHFTWDFGDGRTERQDRLAGLEHAFNTPGTYLVTVRGHSPEGHDLGEQVAIHVNDQPDTAVKYDLALNGVFNWQGPWGDSGQPDHSLVTYRHVPNAGALPAPVLVGGQMVDDDERGQVLEFDGNPHQGIWLIRHADTVMDKEGQANQTVSMWFKAADIEGRQMLYAQGYPQGGFNLYLDGGTLYAGSWATSSLGTDQKGWHPIWGRSWNGHWLTHEGIEPDVWYHVELMLQDATTQVTDDRQHLRVNGQDVASGPGVQIPRHFVPPRIACARVPGRDAMTRFHDDTKEVASFRGRINAFRFTSGTGADQ